MSFMVRWGKPGQVGTQPAFTASPQSQPASEDVPRYREHPHSVNTSARGGKVLVIFANIGMKEQDGFFHENIN